MDAHDTAVYQIRITGRLDDDGAAWFAVLTVTHDEHGETTRCGSVVDQATLVGLLARVRDLNLPLRSVCCLAPACTG